MLVHLTVCRNSGPIFVLYNASLRDFPERDVECLMGNKYETTISVITSGIMKLSKITEIPKNRRLYRGLSGMILPRQFWEGFEECVVTVKVEVDTNSRPGDIVQHIMSFKVAPESVSNDTAFEINNTYLLLPLMGDMKVRVVLARMEKATSHVRLVLALPLSESQFNTRLSEFQEALLNVCGKEEVTIKIEKIVGKNRDFQGGGTVEPLHSNLYSAACPSLLKMSLLSLHSLF
jgi:hypothetical protein